MLVFSIVLAWWNFAQRSMCTISVLLFFFPFSSKPDCTTYTILPFSSNSHITWLHPVDGMFHLIFATAPILWLLGILPPIDAYILWFLEQWHVLVLGKHLLVWLSENTIPQSFYVGDGKCPQLLQNKYFSFEWLMQDFLTMVHPVSGACTL